MEHLVSYFSDIPSTHRAAILFGGIFIFMLIENAAPLFRGRYNKWKHTWQNIFFTLTTILVNFSMAALLVGSSLWVVDHNFGILQWTAAPTWIVAVFGLMGLDFMGAFLPHFVEHKVKFLWQFHVIHHSDQHVDTTTANRHHPGESVLRFLFTLAAVFAVGAPLWLVFMYQSISVVLAQFNHANISLPEWVNNILEWVIVTPDMHHVHHHYRQPYSDTNYGNIFSMWDRLFGTYVTVDNSKLVYGVDTYMDPTEVDSIPELLKIPFKGYRPHIAYDEEEQL